MAVRVRGGTSVKGLSQIGTTPVPEWDSAAWNYLRIGSLVPRGQIMLSVLRTLGTSQNGTCRLAALATRALRLQLPRKPRWRSLPCHVTTPRAASCGWLSQGCFRAINYRPRARKTKRRIA